MGETFSQKQITALTKALKDDKLKNITASYLDLKEMRANPECEEFRNRFMNFYGMNKYRQESEFLNIFFGSSLNITVGPYDEEKNEEIVRNLLKVKIKQKKQILHFSFVSKLVNLYDESMPIYDTHVCYFFERGLYKSTSNKDRRIEAEIRSYKKLLLDIRETYQKSAEIPEVKDILKELEKIDERLKVCNLVRLLDFLVYTVGVNSLLDTE